MFQTTNDGYSDFDVILDYSKADGDVIALPDGAASITATALVTGAWELTLAGGNIVRLVGVTDVAGDGILNDLVIG